VAAREVADAPRPAESVEISEVGGVQDALRVWGAILAWAFAVAGIIGTVGGINAFQGEDASVIRGVVCIGMGAATIAAGGFIRAASAAGAEGLALLQDIARTSRRHRA